MYPLVADALTEEVSTLVELMGEVVLGEGLAGPLALAGALIIAVSVGIIGVLVLGAVLAPVRSP